MRRIREEYDTNPVCTVFLILCVLLLILFIIAAIVTSGSSFKNMFCWDPTDTFMDHFDSIVYSSDRPYTHWEVIYPPLVTIFYAVLGHFILPYVEIPAGDSLSAELIKNSQMGILSFFFITLLTFYALYLVCSRLMKDMGYRKELFFLFAVIFAYPFIHTVDRGNNIVIALVLCFLFLMGYRSENKIIRYASYIALGCAAGFKLYPAILGLLVLRERKYREMAICASIVAALVFVPFVFTDGNPMMLLDTLSWYVPTRVGVSLSQIISWVLQMELGLPAGTVSVISYSVTVVFTLLSFIVILFDRNMKFWKVVALLSCNLILGPGIGTQYQIVYMTMPILYFLISEKEMTRENMFYAICFAMTMVLIPGIEFAGSHFSQGMIGVVESVSVIIIAMAIIGEGLIRIYRNCSGERGRDAGTAL